MSLGNDSILRQVIVQICIENSVIGSGCIVPSGQDGLFYCLTARHCLKKDGFTLRRITDCGETVPLEYTEKIEDDGFDVAVRFE